MEGILLVIVFVGGIVGMLLDSSIATEDLSELYRGESGKP